jgi:hypothetical protein
MFHFVIIMPMNMPQAATFDPTDKSMPPDRITKFIPKATIAFIEI